MSWESRQDPVDVEIDRVIDIRERSTVVQKDGDRFVVGNSVIDNLQELEVERDNKKESKLLRVPRWLARENEWPEGDDD